MSIPLLFAVIAGLPVSSDACLVEIQASVRKDTLGHLTLRATADSVFDGMYHMTMGGIGRGPGPYGRPRAVYGQRFRVLTAFGQASAAIGNHTEVVVVWWGLGGACQLMLPRASTRVDITDLFLAKVPRAESEWIEGLPTYDVSARDWIYFAGRFGDSSTVRAMTVSEMASMYELLPVAGSDHSATLSATDALLAWANQDPERWNLSPAWIALCTAVRTRRALGHFDQPWPARCAPASATTPLRPPVRSLTRYFDVRPLLRIPRPPFGDA